MNSRTVASWSAFWLSMRTRAWARRMRQQGAVVIDTETTDLHGAICELALVDVDGNTLLDTLINPGCPISPAAAAVHGITEDKLATAPTLDQVLPQLLDLTRGRTVLAYNAPYDRDVLLSDAKTRGLDLEHLGDPASWACIMRARAVRGRTHRWTPLEAGHRALGDAAAAAAVLQWIAA